jgi:DNA-binding transcriptional ArsR family regulator
LRVNAKSRLTHEERLRIAAWLTEGHGYAEIGRRLGRPTSTISREVARNGVPGVYRADDAQRTAGHRARRRKPAQPVERVADDRRGFVDEFASLLAETGMPRMCARVFLCLLTADTATLTAADLVRRLGVSPASVSKAIAALETMELVARQPEPGRRRERYLVEDDVWLRAWEVDTSTHRRIADAAQRGIEVYGEGTTAGVRLENMGRFFGSLSEHMHDSTLAEAAGYDGLTVIAALVHAGRPLTSTALATALDWSHDRTTAAIDAAQRVPAIADPLVLQAIEPATYAVAARPDRLSPAQRRALEA